MNECDASVAWFLSPTNPSEAANFVKPFALSRSPFIPIFGCYASCLIELGRYHEVELLLQNKSSNFLSHPLILEIKAQLSNDFTSAIKLLEPSSWPSHRYSKLMWEGIVSPEKRDDVASEKYESILPPSHSHVMSLNDYEIRSYQIASHTLFVETLRHQRHNCNW
ncbi:MAG: hypothetical protein LDL41_06410 [Coleofasciculus sp. S288]|nr:hypothetical protein [Coleofasciculus sp. S288]